MIRTYLVPLLLILVVLLPDTRSLWKANRTTKIGVLLATLLSAAVWIYNQWSSRMHIPSPTKLLTGWFHFMDPF